MFLLMYILGLYFNIWWWSHHLTCLKFNDPNLIMEQNVFQNNMKWISKIVISKINKELSEKNQYGPACQYQYNLSVSATIVLVWDSLV